jgi:hypothetical protein
MILLNLELINMRFMNIISTLTRKTSKKICHFKMFYNRLQMFVFKSIKLRILNTTGMYTGNFLDMYS